MGLVFNELGPTKLISKSKTLVVLTSANVKFLRSLGFKVKV